MKSVVFNVSPYFTVVVKFEIAETHEVQSLNEWFIENLCTIDGRNRVICHQPTKYYFGEIIFDIYSKEHVALLLIRVPT